MGSRTLVGAGLRVAVIGLGRMGIRHLEAVFKLGMAVCGIADLSTQAQADARSTYGLDESASFADGLHMLRITQPDALVVATTAPSHSSFVIAAAEQGVRYILCEKPMAVSLREAEAMLEACQRTGSVLAVNHQMRFMDHYAVVKSLIGTEGLGPLASILVAGSNFGLAMNASHYFEMFRYMTDTSIHSLQAWLDDAQMANPRGPEFQDRSGRLLARNENGLSMYVDFSADAGHGITVIYICREGQIVIDELNGDLRVTARKRECVGLPTTRYGLPGDIRTEKIQAADVVTPTMKLWSAMLAGQQFPDAAAGIHALRCCIAAHASHEAGTRAVCVEGLLLPRERVFRWA